jgi:hypothetical protein
MKVNPETGNVGQTAGWLRTNRPDRPASRLVPTANIVLAYAIRSYRSEEQINWLAQRSRLRVSVEVFYA